MVGATHLIIPAIMAFVALGARYAMLENNILGPIGRAVEKLPSAYLRKPLGTCERCMVSLWGTAGVLVLGVMPGLGLAIIHALPFGVSPTAKEWHMLVTLPVYWLAAVGIQEMFDQ